jgi:hypothetical protein
MIKNIIKKIEKKFSNIVIAIAENKIVSFIIAVLWWTLVVLSFFKIINDNPLKCVSYITNPILGIIVIGYIIAGIKVIKSKKYTFVAIIKKAIKKETRRQLIEEFQIEKAKKDVSAIGISKNIILLTILSLALVSILCPVLIVPIFIWAVIEGSKIVIGDITRIVTAFQQS